MSEEANQERAEALRARAEHGDPDEVGSEAESLLSDLDPRLRVAGLDVLGRLVAFRDHRPRQGLIARLLPLAEDQEPAVRAELAVALALLGDGQPEALSPIIGRLLADEASRVRREAAAAAGDLRLHGLKEKLAERLSDEDREARFEAAFALACLQDARALPLLSEALESTTRRLDACEALRRLGNPNALPPLRRLSDRLWLAWADRLSAQATMHALGDQTAEAKILARLSARRKEERAYVLALVGSHRLLRGRAALQAVARDPHDPLRDTAVRALAELGPAPDSAVVLAEVAAERGAPLELRQEALSGLLALSRSGDAPAAAELERLRPTLEPGLVASMSSGDSKE